MEYSTIYPDTNTINPFNTNTIIQNLNLNNQYLHSQLSS